MSEVPAPYTGTTSAGPPQPAFPTVFAPRPVTWHSRALLIALAGFALIAAVATVVGGSGFPGNAPVEMIYCFGLIVDLLAMTIALVALLAVEQVRRSNPDRRAREVSRAPSVFAIVAIALSALTLVAWAVGGGAEQLVNLITGVRGRYMYHTGGIFIAGIPWALGAIFGAWGFRPGGGHRVTNVLGLVAIAIGVFLAVVSTIAALVYGAGLSD